MVLQIGVVEIDAFAAGLFVFGEHFAIFVFGVNLLSALLTLVATLFYVFVYTKWLKRTTPQNIVIGGAAGAIPPLVGWAAVTGGLDLPAVYLFAFIFFLIVFAVGQFLSAPGGNCCARSALG